MIVRSRPHSLILLFTLRGSILPTIAPRVLLVMALSALVALWGRAAPAHLADLTPAPFTLLGLAHSIFLGFRNNACYERWWEARRQWGQLIAEARALMRDGIALLPDDAAMRLRLAHRIIAFCHALRDQLRGDAASDFRAWLPPGECVALPPGHSAPDAVLLALSAELRGLMRRGELSDIGFQTLSERLWAITTIQTACERLRATPTPFTYTLLLHRTAWLFCLLLPFGLVSSLGLATPLATAILAYAFFGLDALGDELERPFARVQNGIPLDAMVRAIEIATLGAAGVAELPQPLQPKEFLLL
jgi:putative membrane protein